jgi:hypothetical protein
VDGDGVEASHGRKMWMGALAGGSRNTFWMASSRWLRSLKGIGDGSGLGGEESIASWKRWKEDGGKLEADVDEDLREEADEDVLAAIEKEPAQLESLYESLNIIRRVFWVHY